MVKTVYFSVFTFVASWAEATPLGSLCLVHHAILLRDGRNFLTTSGIIIYQYLVHACQMSIQINFISITAVNMKQRRALFVA